MNVAVGGDYLGGPDEGQLFAYPEGEMWVDWVKWYTNCDLGWNTDCAPLPTWVPETSIGPTDDDVVSTPEPTPGTVKISGFSSPQIAVHRQH